MEARSVLCAALILASCLSQARTFPEDMRILAFGDSLTSGVGGSGTNYPEQLSMWLRVEVINAGGNGETSEDGLRRLSPALRKWQPHLLILCLGLSIRSPVWSWHYRLMPALLLIRCMPAPRKLAKRPSMIFQWSACSQIQR